MVSIITGQRLYWCKCARITLQYAKQTQQYFSQHV